MELTYSPVARPRVRPLLWGAVLVLATVTAVLWWEFVMELPRQISVRRARQAAVRTELRAASIALDAFEVDTGRFPTDAEGIDVLWQPPAKVSNWNGPYLRRAIANDPWGRPYLYARAVVNGRPGFRVTSLGPDGKRGTPDDIVQVGP